MDAPIHVTKTPRIRTSFVLVVCAILFFIIAVSINFDLPNRYDLLTWDMTHPHASFGLVPPPSLPLPLTPEQIELAKLRDQRSKNEIVQGGISGVLLFAAVWRILSKRYTPTDRHWAYGTIGTLVGFWLGSVS
jgi:hypothetical protein